MNFGYLAHKLGISWGREQLNLSWSFFTKVDKKFSPLPHALIN